jgi:monothiol glutaredoxin
MTYRAAAPLVLSEIRSMNIEERIRQTVNDSPIVLFMKGTPQFPMCGFSSRAVQALKSCGAQFASVNVLEDPDVRANLPRYSNWPTFPQLFINGELIGGCDITLELQESGELARMVKEAQKAA